MSLNKAMELLMEAGESELAMNVAQLEVQMAQLQAEFNEMDPAVREDLLNLIRPTSAGLIAELDEFQYLLSQL